MGDIFPVLCTLIIVALFKMSIFKAVQELCVGIGAVVMAVPAMAMPVAEPNSTTTVSKTGDVFVIDNGTLSGNGDNLFKSFLEFNLESGQTARFIAPPNVRNVLARVVGGNESMIDGRLQVLGNADLYLMNPAGITIGRGASLDVPGSFFVTTASGIGFENNNFLTSAGTFDASLLNGDPIAFVFKDTIGFVTNFADLAVNPGETIFAAGVNVFFLRNSSKRSEGIAITGNLVMTAIGEGGVVRLSRPGDVLGFELAKIPVGSGNLSFAQMLTGAVPLEATSANILANGEISLTGNAIVGATLTVSDGTLAAEAEYALQSTDPMMIPDGNLYWTAGTRANIEEVDEVREAYVRSRAEEVKVDRIGSETNSTVLSVRLKAPQSIIADGIHADTIEVETDGSIETKRGLTGRDISVTSRAGEISIDDVALTFDNNQPTHFMVSAGGDILIAAILPQGTGMSAGESIVLNSQGNVQITNDLVTRGSVQIMAGNDVAIGGATIAPLGVDIRAGESGSIIGQGINTSADEDAGTLSLAAGNDITATYLIADSLGDGQGGDVTLEAGGSVRITATTTDRVGLQSSVSSQGGSQGGNVLIRHGGNGVQPFDVGDASQNGTAGAIRRSSEPEGVIEDGSFLFTHYQDDQFLGLISVPEPTTSAPMDNLELDPSMDSGGMEAEGMGDMDSDSGESLLGLEGSSSPAESDDGAPEVPPIISPPPPPSSSPPMDEGMGTGTEDTSDLGIDGDSGMDMAIAPGPEESTIIPEESPLVEEMPDTVVDPPLPNEGLPERSETSGGPEAPPEVLTLETIPSITITRITDPELESIVFITDPIAAAPNAPSPSDDVPLDELNMLPFIVQRNNDPDSIEASNNAINDWLENNPLLSLSQIQAAAALDNSEVIFSAEDGQLVVNWNQLTDDIAPIPLLWSPPPIASLMAIAAPSRPFSANEFSLNALLQTAVEEQLQTAFAVNPPTNLRPAVVATPINEAIRLAPDRIASTTPDINQADFNLVNLPNGNGLSTLIANDNAEDAVTLAEETLVEQFEEIYGEEFTQDIVTLTEVRELLSTIEQKTGDRGTMVYVLPGQDWLSIIAVSADEEALLVNHKVRGKKLIELAARFRDSIIGLQSNTQHLKLGEELYQELITPIEEHLERNESDTIIFAFQGDIQSIPVAALYDGEKYLIEKYNTGLVPSVSLMDRRYTSVRNAPLLAMGSRDFREDLDQPTLPGVEVELETISALWDNSHIIFGEDFTFDNFFQQRGQNEYGILHLATHARFDAVIFDVASPSTHPPQPPKIYFWDESLSLQDLQERRWITPDNPVGLLVLSACETILGDYLGGDFGFAGLAVRSGAKSVLGSRWKVEDGATTALMSRFYTALRSAPIKSSALREAQLSLLRGEVRIENQQLVGLPDALIHAQTKAQQNLEFRTRDGDFSHPYYWASFDMVNPW